MILRINLVQNYSSKFGNSQQQFTVTDGGCKHYTSNTAEFYEKWLRRETKATVKAMRTSVRQNYSIITNKQLEQHAQQAAHNAQQVHQ